jgi:uncharacterized protein YigA (DUF484 family)
VSRIETGAITPRPETLERILDALEAPARVRTQVLNQLHGLLSDLTTWESVMRTGRHRMQERIRRLEATTATLRNFQPSLVPGLLQTPRYAEQLLLKNAARNRLTGATDVAATVAVRMERQRILEDETKRIEFVVTEAPLRYRLCGPGAMAEQMDRLIAASRLSAVRLGIIPFAAELPLMPLHPFVIYDDGLVSVETFGSAYRVRDPATVGTYLRTFELLAGAAAYGEEARAILGRVADDYRRETR